MVTEVAVTPEEGDSSRNVPLDVGVHRCCWSGKCITLFVCNVIVVALWLGIIVGGAVLIQQKHDVHESDKAKATAFEIDIEITNFTRGFPRDCNHIDDCVCQNAPEGTPYCGHIGLTPGPCDNWGFCCSYKESPSGSSLHYFTHKRVCDVYVESHLCQNYVGKCTTPIVKVAFPIHSFTQTHVTFIGSQCPLPVHDHRAVCEATQFYVTHGLAKGCLDPGLANTLVDNTEGKGRLSFGLCPDGDKAPSVVGEGLMIFAGCMVFIFHVATCCCLLSCDAHDRHIL